MLTSLVVALLTNTPNQDEFLPYNLVKVAKSIGIYVNADKTGFMYFK